jgi:predicted P-loop ATPase
MINDNHVFDVTTAPKRDSRHWQMGQITWAELAQWMETPAGSKACGNYVLGRFTKTTVRHPASASQPAPAPCTDLHRTKTAIVSRGALTLDVDYPADDFELLVSKKDFAYILHTTYSSTVTEPRYRLIIPLSRIVSPDEYHVAAAAVMQDLGVGQFDAGSVQPERYMFRPSEARKGLFWYDVHQGPLADVETLLEDFQADLSDVPMPRVGKNKRDPFALEGTVGAFNRAYADFDTLIQDYDLPYASAGADRWHLVGASAAAGMGVCAPGLVYSHHANDPAYGQTCSAFDLARLHLFGWMDENAKPATPIHKLPSTDAMREVATQDVKVVTELVGADFAASMDATAEAIENGSAEAPDNWRLAFQLNSRTGMPNDVVQNWDLIVDNDPSFAGLYYNELSMAIETETDLPWRVLVPGRETFDNGDRSSLLLYIEREYNIRPTRTYMDDLINDKAQRRRVNPVLDYLKTLKWDGESRIETALPGVRPTPYTRLAARKSLVAAVARMYEPGIKWDHMLVFYGLEGLGKSFWVERMSRGYSAGLGRIGDKDTLITMQRSWIMTSDEGHSLRKADFDAQKEFLTRTADIFRMPYEREAQVHKRHCVIWGSTNDDVFLRRQEGNRRFLIVKCEDKVDFDVLTEEYVDQVWAEAVHLYKAGEQLWLTQEESDLAAVHREAFTEEDALTGIIHEYLETLVPTNWDSMSPVDRQMWLMNSNDGMTPLGTQRIDVVCSVQIWVEALGRRYGDHKRVDLLEISAALKQLEGWVSVPGRKRVHGYGPQLTFQRLETLEGSDLL